MNLSEFLMFLLIFSFDPKSFINKTIIIGSLRPPLLHVQLFINIGKLKPPQALQTLRRWLTQWVTTRDVTSQRARGPGPPVKSWAPSKMWLFIVSQLARRKCESTVVCIVHVILITKLRCMLARPHKFTEQVSLMEQ